MLSIIVAKAKNNVIGKDNKLIWKIPEDLKYFKTLTTGHTIIMGRRTFESLGRVLPKRKHIIFTKNNNFFVDDENVQIVHEIAEIKDLIESEEEHFVIGGVMIYKMLMPYSKKMYITQLEEKFEGDAVFPEIPENEWKIVDIKKAENSSECGLNYKFLIYEKI